MKRKLSKKLIGRSAAKWSEKLWEQFLEKLVRVKSKNELKNILEKLLSSYEKNMMLRRLAVAALVRSGKSYREIGEILWLSHPTISTIKKNLFSNSSNYKSYRAFYGGPIKWGSEIKIKTSCWESLFDSMDNIDPWELFMNPPRPIGMGLKEASRKR